MNLPENKMLDEYKEYMHSSHKYCEEIGVVITGGHTGFSDIGPSTLAGGGTMFSVVDKEKIKNSTKAKPAKSIHITKPTALSRTAILAKSFPKQIERKLGEKTLEKAQANFYRTSTLPQINAIHQEPSLLSSITALHDVTEGGILGAIYEMSEASKIGVEIDVDKIPVDKEVSAICELFKIDPLASIGAGSLLLVCDIEKSQAIVDRLNKNNIKAAIIGETCSYEKGKTVLKNGGSAELMYQETDPYWAAYFNAITKKLD